MQKTRKTELNITVKSAFCWLTLHNLPPPSWYPVRLLTRVIYINPRSFHDAGNCNSTWRLAEARRHNEDAFHVTVCYALHNNSG